MDGLCFAKLGHPFLPLRGLYSVSFWPSGAAGNGGAFFFSLFSFKNYVL